MISKQHSFKGGMDTVTPDYLMASDSYRRLVNGRQRVGKIVPNPKPMLVAAPAGKKQGIISVGNVTIMFVAGFAYYNVDGNSSWIKIPNFQMDALSDYYTQTIPSSTFKYARKLDTPENVRAPIVVNANFAIAGTPAGILVQDTINQPWIIFYDETSQTFTARVTGTYSSWTQGNPEYVPIGKQMMFLDQMLLIEARDGKSIYRSVSGMPLNFVVRVDVNGDKNPIEAQGGATATSFAFDFDEVTCIVPINVASSFVYATANTTRIITADYASTIFGEPTFKVAAIITTGVVNQQSFSDVDGEYAFISSSGALLFNAVQQLKWRGKNSNFSYPFTKWLQTQQEKTIKQYRSIIFSFDNYVLFGMDSILGFVYFVFDSMQGKWVGVDVTAAGIIEHATITETETELKLYVTNSKNEVWQLYADATNRETAILSTRAFFSTDIEADKDAKIRHKSQHLIATFKNGIQDGMMNAIEYADDKLSGVTLSQTLPATVSAALYPVFCPVRPSSKQLDDTKTFAWRDGLQGKKLSYVLKWDTDAELHELQLTTTEYGPDAGPAQSMQSTQSTYAA